MVDFSIWVGITSSGVVVSFDAASEAFSKPAPMVENVRTVSDTDRPSTFQAHMRWLKHMFGAVGLDTTGRSSYVREVGAK